MNSERMKKVYYNFELTNSTDAPVDAKYTVGLLKPIIQNPQNYNINVNRFRLPLNGVPLSRKNIPFEKWSVGMGYKTAQGWDSAVFNVPQINPLTQDEVLTYLFLTQSSTSSTLGSDFQDSTQSGTSITGIPSGVKSFDTQRYYCLTGTQTINAYKIVDQTLVATITTVPNVNLFCADSFGNLYVYNNGNVISKYTINQAGNAWTLQTLTYSLGTNPPALLKMCVVNNYLVGMFAHYIYVWDMNTSTAIITSHSHLGTNQDIISDGNALYVVLYSSSEIRKYLVVGTTLLEVAVFTLDFNSSAYTTFIGFDNSGNYMLVDYGKRPNKISVYSSENGSMQYIMNDPNGATTSYYAVPFPAEPVAVDNPNANIITYQQFINQINMAFSTVFTSLKTKHTTITMTDAPRLIFNPESKLFSIVCDGDFTDDKTYRLYMNSPLWNMFLFPSSDNLNEVPSDFYGTYKTLLVQNNIFNAVFASSTTTPQFVSVIQESSTMFKFYDLVRILVTTSKIPVAGDIEGTNNTVNLITDIVPDTSTLTPDDVIIYQPTVLRNYNLDSNVPLRDLDLQFYYGCKDGSVYPVKLLPGEYASVKIEFEQVVSE